MIKTKIPLGAWLVLLFRPRVIVKEQIADVVFEFHFKTFGRRLFLIKRVQYTPPPEHFNCLCTRLEDVAGFALPEGQKAWNKKKSSQ